MLMMVLGFAKLPSFLVANPTPMEKQENSLHYSSDKKSMCVCVCVGVLDYTIIYINYLWKAEIKEII